MPWDPIAKEFVAPAELKKAEVKEAEKPTVEAVKPALASNAKNPVIYMFNDDPEIMEMMGLV